MSTNPSTSYTVDIPNVSIFDIMREKELMINERNYIIEDIQVEIAELRKQIRSEQAMVGTIDLKGCEQIRPRYVWRPYQKEVYF